MSEFILFLHSWLRWIILALGLYMIIKGFSGSRSTTTFTKRDNSISAAFTGLFYLQALLGLVMYFFYSTLTQSAMENFGAAMKNADLRYWAVEHITVMIIALVVMRIGRSKVKKGSTDKKKFKAMWVYTFITLLLVALRIPWTEAERLLRGL